MRKTSVDIDERLVEQAKALLGTLSIKETINVALQEIVRMDMRRQEIRALARMDGLDLADAKAMAKAWRS
ncbi:MAG: type II toxin-antitoxin system VapB family antitoxin [Gammaproteobacteria bacterium]|nr:type II toxin-antitoxin system VapB family antitoxin [Gammaproteobacteria bacterium]MCY4164680.1 type II toxin-antitoxin system VapB family antitoxin [Gammaproteobacteria bacterium]MCY4255426.1 type II toxin-antitoxin system VapB family antitoxin [Gammaproteobacteria bacterium]MCY4340082.1 type II toxin-antitoxin system VapB family antitoxin [Gammaproteobacteria bacterium]